MDIIFNPVIFYAILMYFMHSNFRVSINLLLTTIHTNIKVKIPLITGIAITNKD